MSLDLDYLRSTSTGHSATVKLWLHMKSGTIPLTHVEDREVRPEDASAVLRGNAEVEVIVDGRSHRRAVRVVGPGTWKDWIAIEER